MSNYIRAEVLTNSIDDRYHRVRVTSEGFFEKSDLIPVWNQIPLNQGDVVILDISQGIQNPMVVAKFLDKTQKTNSRLSAGQTIFESSNGSKWQVLSVTPEKLVLENSQGMSLTLSDKFIINDGENLGMVNVKAMTERFNKIERAINSLKSVFSIWEPVPKDGGNALYSLIENWKKYPLTETVISDTEDTQALH